jgi:hypothetical protein
MSKSKHTEPQIITNCVEAGGSGIRPLQAAHSSNTPRTGHALFNRNANNGSPPASADVPNNPGRVPRLRSAAPTSNKSRG